MNRKIAAARVTTVLLAACAAGQASAADWFVYAQSEASARSDAYSGEIVNTECNGPGANPSYCGPALISTSKTNASQSAGATEYPNPASNSGLGIQHGDGFALADLATGELKIVTDATGSRSAGDLTIGGAFAEIRDTVHFDAGSAVGLFPVTVDIRLDGRFLGYTQPGFSFYAGNSDANVPLEAGFGLYSPVGIACTNPAIQSPCDSQAQMLNHALMGDWTVLDADHLVGTFYVDPAHPDWSISMQLGAGGSTEYGNTFTEFGDTAALQLQLPRGVTYTSDSGVFLSAAPAGGVPEPASWALMLVGFGLAGAGLRRNKSSVATLGRRPI